MTGKEKGGAIDKIRVYTARNRLLASSMFPLLLTVLCQEFGLPKDVLFMVVEFLGFEGAETRKDRNRWLGE
jgi:hypothetical protein